MSVSNRIVNILNQEGIPTNSVVDIFTRWRKIQLSNCDMLARIKSEKERIIRYSDSDDSEDVINLLMDLEINQMDHQDNQESLTRRVKELSNIIEYLVDNYEIDLRDVEKHLLEEDYDKFIKIPKITHPIPKISDEMWMEATKQRRRENRLDELLEKDKDGLK